MAHNPESFKVNNKKKVITIYTNVDSIPAEQTLIGVYISQGFSVKIAEKKATLTIEDMREELKGDEKALRAFNDAYQEKQDKKDKNKDKSKDKDKIEFKETGFAKACKIYNDWKKDQKKIIDNSDENIDNIKDNGKDK